MGANGKDFGSVYLKADPELEDNIAFGLLDEGLAHLKGKSQSQEWDELNDVYLDAKDARVGIHTQDKEELKKHVRDVKRGNSVDYDGLFNKYSEKPATAIVERINSGSSLKCQILPTHEIIQVHLTGVQCPKIRTTWEKIKKKDGEVRVKKETAEPMGKEARYFSEIKLLGREVNIRFDAVRNEKNGHSILGSIFGKNGKLHQEALLAKGYGKYADWSVSDPDMMAKLQKAENDAKEAKLKLWKSYEKPTTSMSETDKKQFQALVLDVLSGDKLMIRRLPLPTHADQTPRDEIVALAAIRTPKMDKETMEPWSFEAKEKLRNYVGGRVVTCVVDYVRSMKMNNKKSKGPVESKRKYITLIYKNKNINLEMVKASYASVIYRQYDEERPDNYNDLKAAEKEASNKNKGIHGKRNAPKHKIMDLAYKPMKEIAKRKDSLIGKKFRAVIEKIHTGTRFRVYIPKERLRITFSLSGLIVPNNKSTDREDVRINFEATTLAMKQFLLRDVQIEIDSMDKVGIFLGTVMYPKNTNFTLTLLSKGLAKIRPGKFSQRLVHYSAMKAAEDKAKAGELNMWKGYKEEQAEEQEVEVEEDYPEDVQIFSSTNDSANDKHEIRVTEIIQANHLYMQTADAEEPLRNIGEWSKKLNLDSCPKYDSIDSVTVDTACYARFSESWNRARVLSVDKKTNLVTVVYLDYGNREQLPLNSLRPLIPKNDLNDKIWKTPIQVKEVYMAFILPIPSRYPISLQARPILLNWTIGEIHARLEYQVVQNGVKRQYVTLYRNNENLNMKLIEEGLVFVRFPQEIPEEHDEWVNTKIEPYEDAEDLAKRDQRGCWEKGDIYEDIDFLDAEDLAKRDQRGCWEKGDIYEDIDFLDAEDLAKRDQRGC
eukprot:CAMPEP_0117423508 /NCGR_PEP_ID=MMETSP0758-20121206/4117_1 /TAXON_ID=63605 /ORGANISM="Percolomonas cosmopolitus, Strain AE-1 (ATCC 50343)" /LENGTH=882 /DNA_ID=CAMNT_0005206737 /DNA_START=245 /DNA_END=2890 /DNA_ORIENTATION=+